MTKKLICLLLAAFLGVSLIALFAACRNDHEETPDPPEAESSTVSAPVTQPTAAAEDASSSAAQTTDVFSLELPREETTE